MAKAKSSVLSVLGNKLNAAHEKHANDETKYDTNASLPSGIEGGVAKLITCKFDIYKEGDNKGKPYFRAEGIVVAPKDVDGIPLQGLRTSIMHPMCDTTSNGKTTTFESHLEKVYNHLRLLGVNTAEIDPSDLEDVAETLQESQPYFRFRTWKGEPTKMYPNPRVNQVWNGIIKDYVEEDSTEEVVEDDTAVVADEPEPEPVKTVTKTTKAKEPEKKVAATKKVVTKPIYSLENLDKTLEAANSDDGDAQEALSNIAVEVGLTEDEANDAPSWQALYELIKEKTDASSGDSAEGTSEENGEEEEQVPTPEQGDVYQYQPKGAKKPIECQVTKVDEDTKTVNLKNMVDNKTVYKGVAFKELKQ